MALEFHTPSTLLLEKMLSAFIVMGHVKVTHSHVFPVISKLSSMVQFTDKLVANLRGKLLAALTKLSWRVIELVVYRQSTLAASWIWHYRDGLHDIYIWILRISKDLCWYFPDHVNICQPLQARINKKWSELLRFWNIKCFEVTFVLGFFVLVITNLSYSNSSFQVIRTEYNSWCLNAILRHIYRYILHRPH